MATIRRIELSDRGIAGAMPQTRMLQPAARETAAHAVGAVGRQAVRTLDESLRIINQIKENDAHIAATQWHTAMINGLNGTSSANPDGTVTQVPGISSRTWQDYENSDRSPITDLAEIEKQFRNTQTYRNMDTITRRKFERIVSVDRARYQASVNRMHDQQRIERDRYWDQRAIENFDRELKAGMFGDDESFDRLNEETALKTVEIKYKRFDRNDPRVEAAKREDYNALVRNAAIGRVAALAEDGANGEVKIVGGALDTGNDSLRRAESYLGKLADSGRITEPEAKELAYRIVAGRTRLENRIEGEIRNAAESAELGAYDQDGLAGIEQTKAMLLASAKSMRDGSSVRNAALAAAQKLDQTADKRVQFDIMNDLADGKNLFMSDGKTPIFDPDSRQARLFPSVYQAFTERRQREFNKGFKAAREQNLLAVRGKMMEFAAEGNPQGFYGFLADQVVGRKLTAGDFARLRDEFNTGWMKGFKGSPDQLARQTAMAKNMLGLLKDRLGVDFSEAVRKDDYGDPVLKNGAIDFDEKKELPSAEVKRTFKKRVRHGDLFLSFGSDTGTRREEIPGEQLKGILVQAMNLWSCDGMKITYDPVTGEDLPEGQTHTVSAERDFAALLDRIADERNTLSAAETLRSQAAYAANIRMQAKVDADRRRMKMTESAPVTDSAIEDKDQ